MDKDCDWVVLGNEGLSTMTDDELVKRMVALGKDPEFQDSVIEGRFRVPPEMASSLGII